MRQSMRQVGAPESSFGEQHRTNLNAKLRPMRNCCAKRSEQLQQIEIHIFEKQCPAAGGIVGDIYEET